MRPLRRFLALPGQERVLLTRAAALLWLFRIALWVLPFARTRSLAHALAERGSSRARGPAPDRVGWAVETMARRVPKATCLVRAMTAQVLLARSGYPATMQIGVAKEEGRLHAHAWVESDGRVIVGGDVGGFSVFPDVAPADEREPLG